MGRKSYQMGHKKEVTGVRIIKTPDIDYAHNMVEALRHNDGYCPCKIERTPDTKCICKEFREQESGECQCGLYIKVG